jgi:prepilin-type processing-associated H-X9-DG protein
MWAEIKAGGYTGPAPPEGPRGWAGWRPWDDSPDVLLCPSDDGYINSQSRDNSYAFCTGDRVQSNTSQEVRGVFRTYRCTRIADITDGTTNTAMMSEDLCDRKSSPRGSSSPVAVVGGSLEHVHGMASRTNGLASNPSICYNQTDGKFWKDGVQVTCRFGLSWTDGQPHYVGFNTILPPGAPSCSDGGNWGDQTHMVHPPASRHPGGVNLLLGDGSVDFITSTIDTGDTTVPQPYDGLSRYGVWGAYGSKSGAEMY